MGHTTFGQLDNIFGHLDNINYVPKYKDEAGSHPDINGLDVGDPWQPLTDGGGLCCHGEHSEQAQGDARRHRLDVDPEGHPGEHDDQEARDVRLQQVELELALQINLSYDARKTTYNTNSNSNSNDATMLR